jgi:YHS domain-containing protein
MEGYDVVAYFSLEASEKGVKGVKHINSTLQMGGEQYGNYSFYFSTEDNKALFDNDPWKYAPKYGGF